MNKPGILAFAAQFAPRLFQRRRRTWSGVGVALLLLFGLFVWAVVALIGWLFGQAQGWVGTAREVVAEPARGVLEQVEQAVPGAREKLDAHLGSLMPAPKTVATARDVSGTDLGPVSRYQGLARTYWHREGRNLTVEYEGKADYMAVLDHYAQGFAARGYARTVQSASRDAETHEYTKGDERFRVKVAQKPRVGVSVHIETTLP